MASARSQPMAEVLVALPTKAVAAGTPTHVVPPSAANGRAPAPPAADFAVLPARPGSAPLKEAEYHRAVLVSYSRRDPAALNAAHALVAALRGECDPATGQPFSKHCHADSRRVELWLEQEQLAARGGSGGGGGQLVRRAMKEGVAVVPMLGNAFCASADCVRQLELTACHGYATLPVCLERFADEAGFRAWLARNASVPGGPAALLDAALLTGDAPDFASFRRRAAACSFYTEHLQTVGADLFDLQSDPGGGAPSAVTEAARQLGSSIDAAVEAKIRRQIELALAERTASAPAIEPEPEPESDAEMPPTSVVELLFAGTLNDPPGAAKMCEQIKAAVLDHLWALAEGLEIVRGTPAEEPPVMSVLIKLDSRDPQAHSQDAKVLSCRLMHRVGPEHFTVELSAAHGDIRVAVSGLPPWAAAALASLALCESPAATEGGALRLRLHARIVAILSSGLAPVPGGRSFGTCELAGTKTVILDGTELGGALTRTGSAVSIERDEPSDASASRPRSASGSAVSVEEPVEKRLRSNDAAGSRTEPAAGAAPDAPEESTEMSSDAPNAGAPEAQAMGAPASEPPITAPGGVAAGEAVPAGEAVDAAAASGRRRPELRPVVKLSVKLLDTYNHINTVYYEKQKERAKWDDKKGDYIIKDGDLIGNKRYRLSKVLGTGSFGQVVKAVDTSAPGPAPCEVAIKIIKNKPAFHRQAKIEIELLQRINSLNPAATGVRDPNLVVMLAHFEHCGHTCIVFELLAHNLYDLLRLTRFKGLSLNLVRKFGRQLATSLHVLQKSKIIHCDLKPENILLRHPKRSAIKVIDFGSSCLEGKAVHTYIQSRYYRAPEVILGHKYNTSIDMWSLGCTLVEMHTGEPLFAGSDESNQLRKIAEMLGPTPTWMCERVSEKKKGNVPQSPVPKCREMLEVLAEAKERNSDKEGHTDEDYRQLVDLVHQMLAYNPAERISPAGVLRHPFMQAMLQPPPQVQQAWASPRPGATGDASAAQPAPAANGAAAAGTAQPPGQPQQGKAAEAEAEAARAARVAKQVELAAAGHGL